MRVAYENGAVGRGFVEGRTPPDISEVTRTAWTAIHAIR